MKRMLSLFGATLALTLLLAPTGCAEETTDDPNACDPACATGEDCVEGVCVDPDACDPACASGEECVEGVCVDPNACDPACGDDEECVEGACVAIVECDPACGDGEECVDGACVAVCDPECEDYEMCVDGACVVFCDPECGDDQECIEGTCYDVCDPECAEGELCVNGVCLVETNHTSLTMLMDDFADGPSVTAKCLTCHSGVKDEMLASPHWTWRGDVPGMTNHPGETVGKQDTVNNFCIAVASNEGRCTQCHAGYGWDDATFDLADGANLDCLVCHAKPGTYAKAPKTAGRPAEDVDLELAARSVGATTRANCGACHYGAGGGDNVKKGDLGSWANDPTADADVHMGGQGMTCASCHANDNHVLAGSGLHNPVEEAPLACTDCHQGPTIHDSGTLEGHVAHIACETCHIPTFSRQQATKLEWYWETAGDQNRTINTDEFGKPDYDPLKGNFVWGMDVAPTLAWYNGTYTRVLVGDVYEEDGTEADPVNLAMPLGSIDDATAKISPFKVMIGNQPADIDNKVMAIPHLFGTKSGENPYWGKWDWDASLTEGMAAAGVTYSGNWDFVYTTMYMEIHHEVAPKAQARSCDDCHNGGIDFTELGYAGDPMSDQSVMHATE